MSTTDWILLALLAASMVLGAWRGLVYEVLSVLGWIAAFLLAHLENLIFSDCHEFHEATQYLLGLVAGAAHQPI